MDELFNPGPFRSVATYHKVNLASNWASSGRIYTQLNSANKLTIIRSRNHLTNIGVLNSAVFHFWLLGSEISLNFFLNVSVRLRIFLSKPKPNIRVRRDLP